VDRARRLERLQNLFKHALTRRHLIQSPLPAPSSQVRARIVFDCQVVNDPAMMSLTKWLSIL
jgi:hypothetical protein